MPPIIATPPKFNAFRYGMSLNVTPPKAITFSFSVFTLSFESFSTSSKLFISSYASANVVSYFSLKLNINYDEVEHEAVYTVEDAKMLYDMGIRYIETDILCN